MQIQAFMHTYIPRQVLWVSFVNVCPVVLEELHLQDLYVPCRDSGDILFLPCLLVDLFVGQL